MEIYSLDKMTKGWFIGQFKPAILETSQFEVGIKMYNKGDYEPKHHHRVATEITAIISGKARMNGMLVTTGQVVRIEPGESTDFEAEEDTITVVCKTPSLPNDKYPGDTKC